MPGQPLPFVSVPRRSLGWEPAVWAWQGAPLLVPAPGVTAVTPPSPGMAPASGAPSSAGPVSVRHRPRHR